MFSNILLLFIVLLLYYIVLLLYYIILLLTYLLVIFIFSVWKDDVYDYLSVEKSKQVPTIAELVAAPLGPRGAEARPPGQTFEL